MEMSSQMSWAANCFISDAWAVSRASHASLARCLRSAIAASALSDIRVLGLELWRGVLVRGRSGDVVPAVRVRARLPWRLVAVLRLDQALVGRRVRGLRVAACGDLLAENRDDLTAEQLELVEHGLQRQAGVVHQEQLPLVVAEVLAEGQGLVDDLLRAAHRQRGQLGEVLKAWAVAVDRRLVEVGAELLLRVLGVPREVRLAA